MPPLVATVLASEQQRTCFIAARAEIYAHLRVTAATQANASVAPKKRAMTAMSVALGGV